MVDIEKLRVLAALSDKTLAQVARESGISASTLSRVLSGERRLSAATQERVIRTLVASVIQ